MGFRPDIVTDQTSAHDPLVGYLPNLMTVAEADSLRESDPDEYVRRSRKAIASHVAAMVGFLDDGAEVFDYGNVPPAHDDGGHGSVPFTDASLTIAQHFLEIGGGDRAARGEQ